MNILVTLPLNDGQRARLAAAAPGHPMRFVEKAAAGPADLEWAQIILGNLADPARLRHCRSLRWLQLNNAGTEGYCVPGRLPAGAVLTNATGAYGTVIAEYMLAALLALFRRLPDYLENQRGHRWQPLGFIRLLADSRVLVVGFGDIGRSFGRRAAALGAEVVGVRRRPAAAPDWVLGVYGPDRLDELLPAADVVALCLPGGDATRHTLDARRIGLLKQGAVVLNVGRGSAVDTEALCRALERGRLGGAALDVTDPEPLSADHPLWSAPNTILTPHVSGQYAQPETLERVVELCEENLRRFFAGQPLRSVVDPATGYAR